MSNLWAKFYLWLHGYCTKHGVEKVCCYDDVYCQACRDEGNAKVNTRVYLALKRLGFINLEERQ